MVMLLKPKHGTQAYSESDLDVLKAYIFRRTLSVLVLKANIYSEKIHI